MIVLSRTVTFIKLPAFKEILINLLIKSGNIKAPIIQQINKSTDIINEIIIETLLGILTILLSSLNSRIIIIWYIIPSIL